MKIIQYLVQSWKAYRYRFVPWMKINVTPQKMMANVENKVAEDEKVLAQLIEVFKRLEINVTKDSNKVLEDVAGFQLARKKSLLLNAGTGVFISRGKARKGQVVAIYPGTVYFPSDFLFFQSISNQFIFRCFDNIHIDGKNAGISKFIYKSCFHRDRVGFHNTSDISWISNCDNDLICPLNVGQFVNNQSKLFSANVQYQELNFMQDFPLVLRRFIPNVNVNGLHSTNFLRTVVLVALRDIYAGEELFSNYFTYTDTQT